MVRVAKKLRLHGQKLFACCSLVVALWCFGMLIIRDPISSTSLLQHSFETTPLSCQAVQEVYQMLVRAGSNVTVRDCARLPTRAQIANIYGTQPVIWGQQASCEHSSHGGDRIAIAGLYNAGTNVLEKLLKLNLGVNVQEVSWGKHMPLKFRSKAADMEPLLTIVVIKEPYFWMQSMCRAKYDARWKKWKGRCPNLVPTQAERKVFGLETSFPVRIMYKNVSLKYPSLVHWWSDFYEQYYDWKQPHLIVRYSDLLFHAPAVLSAVAQCLGRSWNPSHFQHVTAPAKDHGDCRSSLLDAVVRYGCRPNRTWHLLPADVEFARQHLNATLMRTFHYQAD